MKDQELDKLSEQELLDLRAAIDKRLGAGAGQPVAEPGKPVKLVALAVQRQTVRCRTLDGARGLTLRPKGGPRLAVEGHILTFRLEKQWTFKRTTYASGEILESKLDLKALNLVPLELRDECRWDPANEYWGEEGDEVEDCLKPIIAAGPRPSFEMEQVLPGMDPDDPHSDPIGDAVDLYGAGDIPGSIKVLHKCLASDLRTIDAHAHLGNWSFQDGTRRFAVERARQHYEVGVAIGELSLGRGFKGVLEWCRIDNRPFLRCLHGLAICRWALGDFKGAEAVFRRMLWLNPRDNQGSRICLFDIERGLSYAEMSRREEEQRRRQEARIRAAVASR